ncbi:MAG: cytochrome c oxidase subunit II [Terriglobales bacterium]
MGLALLFIIWLITLSSTYYFVIQKWAPLPVASANGVAIDHHFTWTYILMGIVFLAAQLALGFLVWKYRDRGQKVQYSHGNTTMEVTWTLLTAVLFIGLNLSGEKIWAEARFQGAAPGAVQVEVTGLQFAWYFRYPGPDGKLGHTKPELEDASVGNPIGIDPDDPAGKDDVVTGTMYLPVDRQAELVLRSQDVIHSFFVPAMRFKQDAVPGLMIHMHFTPTKIGDYEIACAELCGLGHYKMHGILKVVSQEDYDKWLSAKVAEKLAQ